MNGSNAEQAALDNAPTASLQSGISRLCELESRASALSRRLIASKVYIVLCEKTGLRKIGVTKDIPTRLSQLQSVSAYPLYVEICFSVISGSEVLFEALLHQLFSDKRTHGEWFNLDAADMWFLHQRSPIRLHLDRETHFDETPEMIVEITKPKELHFEKYIAYFEGLKNG